MEQPIKSYEELLSAIEELKAQLDEANDTIEAVRTGQVDALVVKNNNIHQLYTLKSTDQTYRVFIEKMTEGAVTLNHNGVIIYSNSQFAKMVGLPLIKVTGTPFDTFIAASDKVQFRTLMEKGWEGDTRGELVLIGLGKQVPVQLSLNTLALDDGISLSIIITDLTFQKQTQLLLKENNEKLRQINHELELSNHDLQQFASVASHDLQEPLRKIQIFSNILKERFANNLSGEAGNYLEKIISSASRMKDLIIDILSYSQLSHNEHNFVLTDLNKLVHEVLEDAEILIIEKGATIEMDDLPSVEVNPGQIRQVFNNIIGNALKFTSENSSPVIQIRSTIKKEPPLQGETGAKREYCYLSFKDNGIGFDVKFVDNIFTLFRRLHTKDKFEGTGIGLAISKKIVEKHRGYIVAKSTEGSGSEFIVVLPVSQSAD